MEHSRLSRRIHPRSSLTYVPNVVYGICSLLQALKCKAQYMAEVWKIAFVPSGSAAPPSGEEGIGVKVSARERAYTELQLSVTTLQRRS